MKPGEKTGRTAEWLLFFFLISRRKPTWERQKSPSKPPANISLPGALEIESPLYTNDITIRRRTFRNEETVNVGGGVVFVSFRLFNKLP